MAQPFKHPSSGIYYLRRKVPPELQSALGREFKKSLKTRDPAEAKGRFARAWAESEEAFALARAGQTGAEVISPEAAYQLAVQWARDTMARLDRTGSFTDVLIPGLVTGVYGENSDYEATQYLSTRRALSEGYGPDGDDFGPWVARDIAETLRRHHLPQPLPGSRAGEALRAAFIEQMHKVSDWAERRYGGEYLPPGLDLPAPMPINFGLQKSQGPSKAKAAMKLLALFESYSKEKLLNDGDSRATRKTLASFGATVQRFIELMGDLDITDISREVVARFRAELARLPAKGEGTRGMDARQLIAKADKEGLPRLSEPTIRNHLRALSAVLSHGLRMQWLTENPVIAGGVGRGAAVAATRRAAAASRRKDYTGDELKAIFSSPVFADPNWAPPRASFGKAWYWLPLLLYYTGARREELAQLQVADVLRSEDGIDYLSILDTEGEDDGERSVKTKGSRRRIPLHPDLIARGFLDYVASQPKGGQLFPALKPNPAGYFGANFGKRWSEYLRKTVKLDSPVSPIHGFRHTFKTLCRDAGIPEDVHDAITGHAGPGGIARDYGSMPLRRMAQELGKLPSAPLSGMA